MFFKSIAVVSLLPMAFAQFAYNYVFTTPTDWVSGAPANVSWVAETDTGLPDEFALLLKIFNTTTNEEMNWQLVNPASTFADFASFTLPDVVPGPEYFLLPVNVYDTSTLGAPSSYFSIA